MNEAWFDANLYAWIPGTALGCLAGLWGALVGTLGPRGRGKPLVFGLGWLLLAASLALAVAGVVAYFSGQSYGIWYGLGLGGVIGVVVVGGLLPVVHTTYRAAEQRSMQAEDMVASGP
jgi:hypothetical protein